MTKHRKWIVQSGTQPSTDVKQEGMNNVLSRASSMTSLLRPYQRGSKTLGGVKAQRGRNELLGSGCSHSDCPGNNTWAVLLKPWQQRASVRMQPRGLPEPRRAEPPLPGEGEPGPPLPGKGRARPWRPPAAAAGITERPLPDSARGREAPGRTGKLPLAAHLRIPEQREIWKLRNHLNIDLPGIARTCFALRNVLHKHWLQCLST